MLFKPSMALKIEFTYNKSRSPVCKDRNDYFKYTSRITVTPNRKLITDTNHLKNIRASIEKSL